MAPLPEGAVGIAPRVYLQLRRPPLKMDAFTAGKPESFVSMDFVVGAGYNVIRPDNASDGFVRFQANFILPK